MKKSFFLSVISFLIVLMFAANLTYAAITISVNPASAPADTATGFTFQTQAATPGGDVQFELFNDVDNDGTIDADEWSLLTRVLEDNGNGWINEGLTPDSNPLSPEITTVFTANVCNGTSYLPADNYFIIRVKNALGETGTAQFSITPAFAPQTVTGTVYEEGTAIPVPNAIVMYHNSAGGLSLAVTESSGAYVLEIPVTGSGEICSEKDGFWEHCLGLTVPLGGVSNYDLYLTPADTQITGLVTESGTGSPVWGAEIWAEQEQVNGWGETYTITGIDGSFTLPVSSGSVYIGTGKYGYLEDENNLTVPAGGLSGYNISLLPANTEVSGTVTEFGTDTPICGAEVWSGTDSGDSEIDTDTDGSFTLPVLAGDIKRGAEKDGYMPVSYDLTVPASGILGYNLSLKPMDAQITGTVTEFGTVNTIPGGEIAANTIEWIWVDTVSDSDGNYTLPVFSGIEWSVNLYSVPGYFGIEPQHVIITPTVPGPNVVNFTAHKETAWIEGTLLDEYGDKAVEGAFYYCNRTNPTPSLFSFGITDSAGHVTVGLGAGDWFDSVSTNNTPELLVDGIPREMVRQPGQVVANITTGEHRSVTSNMYYADGAIEGRVFMQDGITPAPEGVLVFAQTQNALNGPGQTPVGFVHESTNTDANGFYRLPLLGGTWDIKATMFNWDFQSDTQQVILNTDGNDLVDQPGEVIMGIDFLLNIVICSPDSYEPDDTSGQATDFDSVVPFGSSTLSGSGAKEGYVTGSGTTGGGSTVYDTPSTATDRRGLRPEVEKEFVTERGTENEGSQKLNERISFKREPLTITTGYEHRLIVKFKDEVKARATMNSGITSLAFDNSYLTSLDRVMNQFDMSFSKLIQLPDEKLNQIQRLAATRSDVEQPDLSGMVIVDIADPTDANILAAGKTLQGLEMVEFAYIQSLGVPPPTDISPTTPDLVSNQSYRGLDPGMNIDYAWTQGAKGQGIRFSDCEYGWNPNHEDLNGINLHLEPGHTIHPTVFNYGWDSHGTAVIGETSAMDNAYGCKGMAPNAGVYTYPEWSVEGGYRRVTCIANAIADSSPGDVVLLEMQTTGAGGGYAPADYDPAVWTVVKAGTDAGVIVVAAAGNGNQDLDSLNYQSYMNRGDSGAIIVGAGSADTNHDKLSFSTYGSRVNVQGWGESVFTLGYGGYAEYGGDKNQRYTSTFNGTSSASPFVASACVSLQSFVELSTGTRLTPSEMRNLLISTGLPQGSGGHIGPFIDMEAAMIALKVPQTQTHSICPVGDEDWMTFTLTSPSEVTLTTSGPSGDTRMWLYDSNLIQIEYNDNSGTDNFSMIDRVCGTDELPAGTYYVMIDEYGDNDVIDSYDITLTVTECPLALDIKINGSDVPVTVPSGSPVLVTVSLNAGSNAGDNVDLWVIADTPFGWYSYTSGWQSGVTVTYQGQLVNLPQTTVLNTILPRNEDDNNGEYTFYFGVDMNMNGTPDGGSMFYDSVAVEILP